MKIFLSFSLAILLAAAAACSKGSNKDPETNDLGETNPPGQLQSLTRDSKLVLTWIGANAEDDFQGYHVFGTTKTPTELQALVKFPSDADVTTGSSIPRCKDNNDFFAAFGLPESNATCESSVLKEEAETATTLLNEKPLLLAEEESTAETTKIDFNIPCTADDQKVADGSISLAAKDGKNLDRVFCDVEQAYDATAGELVDLANGTSYTYMVVAVKGSDKNNISWISNLAADTPAHTVFAEEVTLKEKDYMRIELDYTNFTATAKASTDCPGSPADGGVGPCKLGLNKENLDGIFIARDNANSLIRQRVFVSTSSNGDDGKFKLQARGNETWMDPRDESTLSQKPGDAAQTTFLAAGTTFAVYGNQVFDLQITTAANQYIYGKVVVTNLSVDPDTEKTGDATLDVTIVLQSQVNSTDYFH